LQEIPIWGAVVLYGILVMAMEGIKKVQTRLSIPRARGYGVGVLKCGVVGPEHKHQAEYKSTGLDPKNEE
jgi:hypothetical protein